MRSASKLILNLDGIMFLLRRIFLFIFCMSIIFTVWPQETNSQKKTDFLFLFFDAGETLALSPVFKSLDENNYDYKILVLGIGARNALIREKINKNVIDIEKECHTKFELGSPLYRENGVKKVRLDALVHCYQPNIVVTGIVSKIQSQLASFYKNSQNTLVVGYDDGFMIPPLKQ